MFKIVRADRAGLALDMWRKRDWVIMCLNSTSLTDNPHGAMSPGFPTKRIAKAMLDAGEVDWCPGCQLEKEQNEREVR